MWEEEEWARLSCSFSSFEHFIPVVLQIQAFLYILSRNIGQIHYFPELLGAMTYNLWFHFDLALSCGSTFGTCIGEETVAFDVDGYSATIGFRYLWVPLRQEDRCIFLFVNFSFNKSFISFVEKILIFVELAWAEILVRHSIDLWFIHFIFFHCGRFDNLAHVGWFLRMCGN